MMHRVFITFRKNIVVFLLTLSLFTIDQNLSVTPSYAADTSTTDVTDTSTDDASDTTQKDIRIKYFTKFDGNILVKGKTLRLKTTSTRTNGVQWISKNTKIASVDQTGVVKGKKIGTARICLKKDGQVIDSVLINVTSKKILKVCKTAYKINAGKYSMAKRMKKGYFDCSSIVWRSYANAGIYIGSKSYAPNGNEIYRALKASKKIIKKPKRKHGEYIPFRVGDIILGTDPKNCHPYLIYDIEHWEEGYVVYFCTMYGNHSKEDGGYFEYNVKKSKIGPIGRFFA